MFVLTLALTANTLAKRQRQHNLHMYALCFIWAYGGSAQKARCGVPLSLVEPKSGFELNK
ncbi:MAG: hypothetical protein EBT59_10645 [Betaproteobacteria bacterium]|nr:hypothetical protein [Betaproteobacteria bacterium]